MAAEARIRASESGGPALVPRTIDLFGGKAQLLPLRLFELKNLKLENRSRNEAQIRALCGNAYLGDDRLLCRVLGRYKMFVDSRDIGLSSHLLLDGYWEMWLTEALAQVIKPGMLALDIGANLGYFTMVMADLVGPTGAVHAFEPNGRLVERLEQSITVNGFHAQAQVHAQALSDQEGSFRLVVPDGEPKNGYLLPASEGEVGLQTRRLDSYADLLDADVIKIDADTSEWSIWRGMAGVLARHRPITIFLEFAAARYADPAAFLDEILSHDLELKLVDFERGVIPITRSEILASSDGLDIMLVLSR